MNPLDWKSVLLAKHAQHVVLVHFPIALLMTAVGFDIAGEWLKKPVFTTVARYNAAIAAVATIPTVVTGFLAWQWQLEGHKLKGILLQHLVMACVSTVLIWLIWALLAHNSRKPLRLTVELTAVIAVAVTGHLGGFLSGVNSPG